MLYKIKTFRVTVTNEMARSVKGEMIKFVGLTKLFRTRMRTN